MDVGARLKTIRKLKGLSQRELAKRAGVTNSTISMIEKNSVSPSVSSLKKVLAGIPMSLVEFFAVEAPADQPRKVVYRTGELLDIGSNEVIMQLVGKDHPDRSLSFLRETYPPAADTGPDMLSHQGEEAGIVVQGRLELTVGAEIHVLDTGDSYYFESSQPHRFNNPFDEPCVLISATTPANF
ncbi:cupin domain-containing protein [Pseudomonas sp. G11-1]|uniref:Cupin domain-containing protein n=1 Tax=Halopseudomonas bauzanensis TaxID=653930 RepID=A0A031ME15_9GAMM|nr:MULTISPECIES: cupin domain-containing protein [Halopseudomonas]MCO5786902.1 cupin domain-containing protein [Pseudomonas sp. G11-1]MCO5790128.1 cupin domain-containing protein [Pseudomonas sp. G11-2]EZQ18029.1 XRE family transcriptional regulator [Halopseudomonas bauzanensis]TKA92798.1 cupin domain-containing protein [Halopseudomonas bauzanensis]WGK61733.1 cupin domain-containing protein [Halopseudomonas sp. SMJS2]